MKRKICLLLSCIALILLVGYDAVSPSEKSEEPSENYEKTHEEILPLSIDEGGKCFVDLSSYPALESTVESDQAKYEEKIKNLENDDENVTTNTYIQRADTRIYSFFKTAFTDKEDEEESINFESFNYDVETGKLLSLEDIVKDQDKLIEAVKEQIEFIGKEGSYPIESSAIEKQVCDSDNRAWIIGYQGLTFYASINMPESKTQYIPIMVSFAKYPWLFEDNYMQAPERYAVEIGINSLFLYDVDGSGDNKEIKVRCEEKNIFHKVDKIDVQIGDLEKTINCNDSVESVDGADLRCHILHLGNKENLLYVHSSTFMDSDIEYSIVLDMNASEIKILNEGTWVVMEDRPLLDPENIICKERNGLLRGLSDFNFNTISSQRIDRDGKFSKNEEIEYYQSDGIGVEVTSELMADKIAPSGENIIESNIELPKGTIMKPIRTDHKTFVDFMDRNDDMYRVKFEGISAADYLTAHALSIKWGNAYTMEQLDEKIKWATDEYHLEQYEMNMVLWALDIKEWNWPYYESGMIWEPVDEPLGEYSPEKLQEYTDRDLEVKINFGFGHIRERQSQEMIQSVQIYEKGKLIICCYFKWGVGGCVEDYGRWLNWRELLERK